MDKYPQFVCCNCRKELGERCLKKSAELFKGYNDSGRVRTFCGEECYKQYKKQFEAEEYKGKPIYVIDYFGEKRYMPYWFSRYYYTDINNCRKRMDNNKIAIPI